jgi:hypothetical protein
MAHSKARAFLVIAAIGAFALSPELCPRTFCTFPREFSSFRRQGAANGRGAPGTRWKQTDRRRARHVRQSTRPPDPRSDHGPVRPAPNPGNPGPHVARVDGQNRVRDQGRRPGATSGLLGRCLRCQSIFRPASVRGTPNVEAPCCAPGRRTRLIAGPWARYPTSAERATGA